MEVVWSVLAAIGIIVLILGLTWALEKFLRSLDNSAKEE
jgi:hypothetical protein